MLRLAYPVPVVRVPIAVAVRVLTVPADQRAVDAPCIAPAPAHTPHVKAAGRTVTDRTIFALAERGIPILAFLGFILMADMAVRNRHTLSLDPAITHAPRLESVIITVSGQNGKGRRYSIEGLIE